MLPRANAGFEFGLRKLLTRFIHTKIAIGLILARILGGKENLWFLDAWKHSISELILLEKKLWNGLKLSSLKFNFKFNFWIWVRGSRHSRELCVMWKFGALICSTKFVFYLSKSTLKSCMEYCYHVWVCASSCYLHMLDKLQKWDCRTVGPSLSTYHEQLVGRCLNVASLSLF